MLEANTIYNSAPPEPSWSGEQSSSLFENLAIALGIVQRQWLIIALSVIAAISAAVPTYLNYKPTYKATAAVAIDTRRFQLFQQSASLGEVTIDSAAAVDSQVEILKSEKIVLQVIKKLHLDDPEAANQGAQTPGWWPSFFGERAP